MRQFEFVQGLTKDDFYSFAKENAESVKTHFLGSFEWGQLSEKRNWQVFYTGIKENGKLVATMLVLKRNLVMGYSYLYIPRGFTMNYDDRELIEFITKSMVSFGKKHKALFFKIDPDIKLHSIDIDGNPVEGESNEDLVKYLKELGYKPKPLNYAFENEQPRFTFRIDISGNMDDIHARYSKTTLHEIRKSQESCVEVRKGTIDDIDEFVRLMKITEARQDFFSHKHDYYRQFYEVMNPADMSDVYVGHVDINALRDRAKADLEKNEELLEKYQNSDSKKSRNMVKEINNRLTAIHKKLDELESKEQDRIVVSSYITMKYIDKVWTLYGANDMNYSRYYPNYAVYERMIEDANRDGYKLFDGFGTVGRPNDFPSEAGLYEFKKKWGGEFTEFIGEFDYIINKPVHFAFSKLIPIYHKIQVKRLKNKTQSTEE